MIKLVLDSKITSYLPSTTAAAIIIHVIREIEPFNAMEYRSQLLGLLKVSEVCLIAFYNLPILLQI